MDYFLHDSEAEKTFDFNLEQSFSKRNKELFKGMIFCITNGCKPGPNILKEIIESSGGQAVPKKRPTIRQLQKMRESGNIFVMVTCEGDLHLCDVMFERNVHIVNAEFILSGILQQQIDFERYSFRKVD